jgi:GcrA cell cycle regulator
MSINTPWEPEWIDSLRSFCASPECGNTRWIARRLNETFNHLFTRNAIIGKMKREGIIAAQPKLAPKKEKTKRTRRSVFNFAKPIPTPIVDDGPALMPTEFPNKCSLMELTNETCRWPVNDPWTPEFFFCGSPEADLLKRVPYCRAHARVSTVRRAA